MTTLYIKGVCNIIKGKLEQRWADLVDNDLQFVDGMQLVLIGRIQKCRSENHEAARTAIKEYVADELTISDVRNLNPISTDHLRIKSLRGLIARSHRQ